MGAFRLMFVTLAFVAFTPLDRDTLLRGEPITAAARVFYTPRADLQAIDKQVIDGARRSIDMAAYVLTDRGVIGALTAAARRGVAIRLYLDPDQSARRRGGPDDPLVELIETPGVETRFKARSHDMHMKTYQVDGRRLRSGSANFSFSGLRNQDNDAIVFESAQAAGDFIAAFNLMWTRRDNELYTPALAERRR
jgi:phosphatidylserine/phosphatidylglycerophosphate/cardiolipin synthase-like enzyme